MLWFWVIVLVAIIGAIAVVAAGRGDSMADVYDDRPDVSLPAARPITAEDLRTLRLNTGVRGYRMDEVDALLGRLQAELLSREADDVRVLSAYREEASTVTEEPGAEQTEPADAPVDALEEPPDDERTEG